MDPTEAKGAEDLAEVPGVNTVLFSADASSHRHAVLDLRCLSHLILISTQAQLAIRHSKQVLTLREGRMRQKDS